MNIDEMPAGIELDTLVAEALGYVRVLAETAKKDPPGAETFVFTVADKVPSFADGVYIRHVSGGDFRRFAPSTDIVATWEIVAKRFAAFSLERPLTVGMSWYAKFEDRGDGTWQDEVVVRATASTAPLAICRAALKFVEARGANDEH